MYDSENKQSLSSKLSGPRGTWQANVEVNGSSCNLQWHGELTTASDLHDRGYLLGLYCAFSLPGLSIITDKRC